MKIGQYSVVSRTPMRITLGGGGTDVFWYSSLKGGAWISAAIDKYVIVNVRQLRSREIKIFIGNEKEVVINLEEISNPIIRECLIRTNIKGGLEIKIATEIPPGSGLGGSGALGIGLLRALYALQKKPVSKILLARQATYIEAIRLKRSSGPQDQYITSLGGIRFFEITTKGKISIEKLILHPSALNKLESNLLFFSTKMRRDADSILHDQKVKFDVKSLDAIKELGFLAKKYLLSSQIDKLGELFHQHWLIKRRLSNKISNPKIDDYYTEAIKYGALGGKIMGAGGGGWFVFYVNKNKSRFRRRMTQIGLIEQAVNFDWEGTKLLRDNI